MVQQVNDLSCYPKPPVKEYKKKNASNMLAGNLTQNNSPITSIRKYNTVDKNSTAREELELSKLISHYSVLLLQEYSPGLSDAMSDELQNDINKLSKKLANTLFTSSDAACNERYDICGNDPIHLMQQPGKPITIRTLGGFSLWLDGREKKFRRLPPRPLGLLKCLIAFGGRQVYQGRVIEALWPDACGDVATKSLHTNLHRLRKLLNNNDAIILQDKMLSINPQQVSIDVWDLERVLNQLEKQLAHSHRDLDEIDSLITVAFDLYGGSFLDHGEGGAWTVAMTERLRNRMLRVVCNIGALCVQHKKFKLAIDIYSKGLDIDPLCESFYQQLMEIYGQQAQISACANTYQQCRKHLAAILGVTPAAQTTAIYTRYVEV